MSMSYWMVFGIGFYSKDLMPYLDPERFRCKLADQQVSFSRRDKALWKKADTDGRFTILEAYIDCTFGFMDFIAGGDSESLLSYGNDGDDGHYLYYEPSYPWNRKENDCKTEVQVKEYLCRVVEQFTFEDTPHDDILGLIYQINQVGIG